MMYSEAIERLLSLSRFGFRPGLETTLAFAAEVGNPHARLRFIHVAGTNGKGSTCAMLEAIYRRVGLKVGLYTSPHLVRFNERIQVNRAPIPDDAVAELTGALFQWVDQSGSTVTFFEFTTVLALMWFERQGCDLVIWETGLGGRLDSTNIVTPLASIITSIGLDHVNVLGETIEAIAAEKAGIIKPGVPSIVGDEPGAALAVIQRRAKEVESPLRVVKRDEAEHLPYELSLLGSHQKRNAALAVAAIDCLQPILSVADDIVRHGLAHTYWPGRLQMIRRGSRTLILDGAHNLDGIQALKAALHEMFPASRPALIIGVLGDKDWRNMIHEAAELAGRVWVVPIQSPRAVTPSEQAEAFRTDRPGLPVTVASGLAEALKASEAESLVVIAGSLYLIGEAIEVLSPDQPANERRLNEWGGGAKRGSAN